MTEYDLDLPSSPPLGASRSDHEYLADQPELSEESDQSSALSSIEWPQPVLGFPADVDFAQNNGFDYSNHPSFSLIDPLLLVQGTTATTPSASTGASSGSINSAAIESSLLSPFYFTSGSSSTNFSSVLTPTATAHEIATPSLEGAPRTLQPNRFLECPDCQRKLSCSARVRKHHCNPKKFFCESDDCTGGFTQEKDLKRHRQTVHADKALLRVCQVCQYKTPRKDHLERHERSHQNIRRKRTKIEERNNVTPRSRGEELVSRGV